MLRRTVLAIALLVFVSIVVGCTKEKDTKEVIKVAINAGPEGDAVKKLAGDYTKAKVEVVALPYNSLREQLLVNLKSTPGFDIVMIDDPWFPQLAENLETISVEPKELLDDIIPASLRLCRYPYPSGEIKALPFVGNTQVLFYRKEMLKKLGINNPPTTWAQVLEVASAVTKDGEKHTYGYAIRGKSGAPIVTDFLPIYWSLGGKLLDNPTNPKAQGIDKKKFIEALRIYKKLGQLSPPGSLNYDWNEMTVDLGNGRVAMELNWPAAIPKVEEGIKNSSGKDKDWGIALAPGLDGSGTSMIGNWLLATPKGSKKSKEAKDLIIWLMEQQGKVATSGNPPTRKSIFQELAKKPNSEYFTVIQNALERSTPRDRTPLWAQVEDEVSRAVSGYMTGKLNESEAADQLANKLNSLFI